MLQLAGTQVKQQGKATRIYQIIKKSHTAVLTEIGNKLFFFLVKKNTFTK